MALIVLPARFIELTHHLIIEADLLIGVTIYILLRTVSFPKCQHRKAKLFYLHAYLSSYGLHRAFWLDNLTHLQTNL